MMDRRHFLASLAASMMPLPLAAKASDDYKALVCVFLVGGNDGNNTLVPRDNAGYQQYASIRSEASGLNIRQAKLLPISTGNVADRYGLHPSMTGIHALFEQGKAAALANVGPLVAPLTRASLYAGGPVPHSLYAHNDQQNQWQNLSSATVGNIGWGGRLGDLLTPMNDGAPTPLVTSLAGSNIFVAGQHHSPLILPASGHFGLTGFGNDAVSSARLAALKKTLQVDRQHALVNHMAEETEQAIRLSTLINPILASTNSEVYRHFPAASNSLVAQLIQVAKIIAARDLLGMKRQVFFVSLGGFDNHTSQLPLQEVLLSMVSIAMTSFYQATVALGVDTQVTQFTMSDFGRTFKPAAGAGTDHAWGNHQMMIGGAVKGNALYGTFPTHVLGAGDDAEQEGRWIPTTSVDQYAATLARWFGVREVDQIKVCPNLNAFVNTNLGFMG